MLKNLLNNSKVYVQSDINKIFDFISDEIVLTVSISLYTLITLVCHLSAELFLTQIIEGSSGPLKTRRNLCICSKI